ncbi:Uncharacterized protein Rs2_31013 [Raphanus sativus]|nr:Uncharacterized protein Rs2_31013 [Raphanus sativus]
MWSVLNFSSHQRTTPYYKRNRAHIVVSTYRYEMPETEEQLSQQNTKNHNYGQANYSLLMFCYYHQGPPTSDSSLYPQKPDPPPKPSASAPTPDVVSGATSGSSSQQSSDAAVTGSPSQ